MGSMSDTATMTPPAMVPSFYQLRVVLRGMSPLIWRRLLIPADTTIAGLHAVLQTAFGWGGEHLHRFVIHGTEYGISYVGGPGFRDDPRKISLGELGLRLGERFTYEYNYFAAWTCDLRVEQITHAQPGRTHPRCVGGRRAGPPEDCGGPWAFLEQTQAHLVLDPTLRTAEILGMFLDEQDIDVTRVGEYRDELASLLPLLGLERFDRRALNRALIALTATQARVA
jgi:Plasmid pRiA4b ORF-3-like protein